MGNKSNVPESSKLYGELYIDPKGKAHFMCHSIKQNFEDTEIAIKKFIKLLQEQVEEKDKCPFNLDNVNKLPKNLKE